MSGFRVVTHTTYFKVACHSFFFNCSSLFLLGSPHLFSRSRQMALANTAGRQIMLSLLTVEGKDPSLLLHEHIPINTFNTAVSPV